MWVPLEGFAYDPIEEVPSDFTMPEPLTLDESLASFQTRPGLRIELVAAEPMVMDPINIDWGPDGKLWVVEMADYPLGMDGKGKPGGRVRFLTDSDGDGKYDRSTLFLDGLNFPTGVKWWKDGVLVVAAPEIFYAEDTDGDGKADKREVLFRGFREGNQQHRVNGLAWGGDGWLHVANGDSGGTVESIKTGQKLELGSFDLRIKPETGEMELTSGRTQYGRATDGKRNWFGCNNSRPLFHYVLPDRFLRRNPHVIYPKASIDLTPTSPKVFPIGEASHRYNNAYSLGHITSACGLTIYRDDRLGEGFRGNAFICEPVHNLVHRLVLEPKGVTFTARRADDEQESEFLASSDTWFRPASALTGPDGGLWVVDMHRYVIEHPEWIPEPWQQVLDLRAGQDRGRIYRVVSERCAPSQVAPDVTLLRRNGKEPEPGAIEKALANGWSADALAQTAARSGKLPVKGLSVEQQIEADADAFEKSLLQERRDEGPTSAWKAVFSLGDVRSARAGEILGKVALAHSDDPYFVAGAMSSVLPHIEPVARIAAAAPRDQRKPLLPYLFDTAVALENSGALSILLDQPGYQLADRFEAYSHLLRALDRRRIAVNLFARDLPDLTEEMNQLASLTREARKQAIDPAAHLDERLSAFAFLGRLPEQRESDRSILIDALSARNPPEIQRIAIRRLVEMKEIPALLATWNETTPTVHQALLTELLANRSHTESLLHSLESGMIPPGSIDSASRDRLVRYPNSKIRGRARTVFGDTANPDRQAVIDSHAIALKLDGNRNQGLLVFQTACAICHRLEGIGRDLGPNLAALSDKTGPSLLAAILDPNRAIEDKYLLYQLSLAGDESLAGMIDRETGDSLTLQLLDGTTRTVLRNQISAIRSTGRSAMPEGLEAALTPQQIADLIAFLQSATQEGK